MAVKSQALAFAPETRRFADVVEQATVGQRLRRRLQVAQEQHRVREHIAFGVIVGTLLDALHGRDFGHDLRKQAGGV